MPTLTAAIDTSAQRTELAIRAKSSREPGDARYPALVGARARVTADMIGDLVADTAVQAAPDGTLWTRILRLAWIYLSLWHLVPVCDWPERTAV